jgi:hypothetical protein
MNNQTTKSYSGFITSAAFLAACAKVNVKVASPDAPVSARKSKKLKGFANGDGSLCTELATTSLLATQAYRVLNTARKLLKRDVALENVVQGAEKLKAGAMYRAREANAIRFAMVRPDAKPKAKATKAKATKAKAAPKFPQIVKAITDGKAKVGIKSPAGDRMITNVEELLNFALEMRDLAASQPKAEAAIVIEATL